MDMERGDDRVRCMDRVTWKQPRCPSTDEWIKLWYLCTMEYYSTIERNGTASVVVWWMDLESDIQK